MRKILFVALSFYLLAGNAVATPLGIGKTVPDWNLTSGEGQALNYYEDSNEKVSVIIFWATSCIYCHSLLPQLDVIYRKYRSKGVKFYAVDALGDGKIDPLEYFEAKQLRYTLLLDGDQLAEQFGVKRTPAVFVVDKEKNVVYKRPTGASDVLVKQNVDLRIKQALAK